MTSADQRALADHVRDGSGAMSGQHDRVMVDARHQDVGQLRDEAAPGRHRRVRVPWRFLIENPSGARTSTTGQVTWPTARRTSGRARSTASCKTASTETVEASSGADPPRS